MVSVLLEQQDILFVHVPRIVARFGAAYLLHAPYNLPAAAGAILLPILHR